MLTLCSPHDLTDIQPIKVETCRICWRRFTAAVQTDKISDLADSIGVGRTAAEKTLLARHATFHPSSSASDRVIQYINAKSAQSWRRSRASRQEHGAGVQSPRGLSLSMNTHAQPDNMCPVPQVSKRAYQAVEHTQVQEPGHDFKLTELDGEQCMHYQEPALHGISSSFSYKMRQSIRRHQGSHLVLAFQWLINPLMRMAY